MRIDKYLKISRIIKRRTVAKEACDQERVMINDKPAKAGSDVEVGDIIKIQFGNKSITINFICRMNEVNISRSNNNLIFFFCTL